MRRADPGKRGCPRQASQGIHKSTAATGSDNIVPATTLTHPQAVAPAYVVFTLRDDGGVKRRNVYLSLHSAIKAKERAEARGDSFELMLCELVPVPGKPTIVVGGAA